MYRRLLFALVASCTAVLALPGIAAARPEMGGVAGVGHASDHFVWVLRFGSYLAIAWVVGLVATELSVWEGAGRVRWLRRSAEAALGVVVVLSVLQLLVLAGRLAGTDPLGGWSRIGDAANTDAGVALVLRIVIAAVGWLLVVRERPDTQQTHRELVLLLGLGLLATWSFTGRAGGGRWPWLAVPVDVVHHAAAAAWIGGLAIVGLVAVPREEPAALATLMPRFLRMAAVSVGLVVVTGVVQAVRITRTPDDLSATLLGRLIVAKVVLVGVVLGLMALTRRRALVGPDDGHRHRVRISLATELVAGVLALGLTASLVGSPIAPAAADESAGPSTTTSISEAGSATTTSPVATAPTAPTAPTSSASSTTSSTAPATTTTVALDLSVLPDVIAGAALGPVPEGTPVRSAGGDEAPVYENGCHVAWGATQPKQGCFYGDTSSSTLVVITGDSEAAHWFGAFDEAGKANGWKIAIVTKAGCPAADVKVYSAADPTNFYLTYPECPIWRKAALEYIRSLRPSLVVFPMLSRRAIVGVPKKVALPNWQEGLGRSIDFVRQPGTEVLVLGDTPKTNGENVAQCVASRQSDVRPCGNSREKAVDAVRAEGLAAAAGQHGATFVDPSNWMCTDTFCPAVIGTSVVYRDKLHLTDRFSRSRAPQIAAAIRYALAGPRP